VDPGSSLRVGRDDLCGKRALSIAFGYEKKGEFTSCINGLPLGANDLCSPYGTRQVMIARRILLAAAALLVS
jgi:hypothetical protein